MALYIDEEEVWKCPKHPSKRRQTGICHVCLRQRLSSLCPDCANVRPCPCYAASTSSSVSSSSYFSRFSSARIGSIGRVSTLIDSEPAFRRSKSLAVSFLQSKAAVDHDSTASTKPPSFWKLFRSSNGNKSKRFELEPHSADLDEKKKNDEERRTMMRKSRSVALTSESGVVDVRSSKSKGWHFPSPIKVFKQSISRGVIHERSPMCRG